MARSFCLKPVLGDLEAAQWPCQRPTGHRGECGLSRRPEPPLRPVRVEGVPTITMDDNYITYFTSPRYWSIVSEAPR